MPSRGGRVTIREVATAAGVSTATVSYVLNDTPGQVITETTRQKVQTAATALGYAPHRIARALREGTSRVVVLNIGAIVGGNSVDSFIHGMSAELDALGHALLVTTDRTSDASGLPPDVLDAVAPRAVLDLAGLAAGGGISGVYGTVDGHEGDLAFHTYVQLEYLVRLGHERIGFLVPMRRPHVLIDARVNGFRRAATELGVKAAHVISVNMDDDHAGRASDLRVTLDTHQVSAFACYDDDVAISVLSALSDLAVSVPDDIAVIGFDEGTYGRYWRPSLTTVRINAEGYGRRAARVALGIEPGPWSEIPSEVIVRESA